MERDACNTKTSPNQTRGRKRAFVLIPSIAAPSTNQIKLPTSTILISSSSPLVGGGRILDLAGEKSNDLTRQFIDQSRHDVSGTSHIHALGFAGSRYSGAGGRPWTA